METPLASRACAVITRHNASSEAELMETFAPFGIGSVLLGVTTLLRKPN